MGAKTGKNNTATTPDSTLKIARELSPRRSTSTATDLDGLVAEQLAHFSIDPSSELGASLGRLAAHIYRANIELHQLWDLTTRELANLDRRDRIALFNAKKFLCFQLAKLLDTLQNPFRHAYQTLVENQSNRIAKGPYPIFDNVTAIFSSTPVIARTATYLYACTEWIDHAFQGREPLLEVYSRLLNPTSISLANHIVDIECGPLASEYMAWNSGSALAQFVSSLPNSYDIDLVAHLKFAVSSAEAKHISAGSAETDRGHGRAGIGESDRARPAGFAPRRC